jgi:hypothetical protein
MRLIKTVLIALCVAAFAPICAQAEDMSFRIVSVNSDGCGANCPQVIAAQGEISLETPEAFIAFVRENARGGKLHGIVLLDSPGGKVVGSMELGQAFRKLGMAVIVARPAADQSRTMALVSGRCYSACVYALMGGRKRVIPPQSSVGIHRMFNYSTSFDITEGGLVRERNYDDGGMLQTLSRYAAMMGVSTELVKLAEQTSPDKLYMLTGADIARWRLGSRKL